MGCDNVADLHYGVTMIDANTFVLALLSGVIFVYLWDSSKLADGPVGRVLNLVALTIGIILGQIFVIPLVFGE